MSEEEALNISSDNNGEEEEIDYEEEEEEEEEIYGEKLIMVDELKDLPWIKNTQDLQTLLQELSEDTIQSTIFKIKQLGFFNSLQNINTFTKNLLLIAGIRRKKVDAFVSMYLKLLSDITIRSLLEESLDSLLIYGFRVNCHAFLYKLLDLQMVNGEILKHAIAKATHKDFNISMKEVKYSASLHPIALAIQNDDADQLLLLLSDPKYGFDFQLPYSDCEPLKMLKLEPNLLKYAAFYGSSNCFRFLMANNVDFMDQYYDDYDDYGIEEYAAAGGNAEIIRILEQNDISMTKTERGLEKAVKFHQDEIFDWMLENNPELTKYIRSTTCIYYQYVHGLLFYKIFRRDIGLYEAVVVDWFDMCKFIIPKIPIDSEFYYCFHISCLYGYLDIVRLFCDVPGLDINMEVVTHKAEVSDYAHQSKQKDIELKKISTAIGSAASEGHLKIVEFIINKFPDLNINSESNNPLFEASSWWNCEVLKLLLAIPEINVNIITSSGTPLEGAIRKGNIQGIELLLNHPKIDINNKPYLLYLRKASDEKIANLLLDHPMFNPEVHKPMEALYSAIQGQKLELLLAILDHTEYLDRFNTEEMNKIKVFLKKKPKILKMIIDECYD